MRVSNKDYIVVTDPELTDTDTDVPFEIEDEIEELYYKAQKGKNSAKDRLLKLIKRYPKLALLKNYLITWYVVKDRDEEASRLNEELLRQYPGYLFAIVFKVNELVRKGKVEEAGAYLNYQTNIEDLYPERKAFHLGEFRAFTTAVVNYLGASYLFEEAESKIALLKEVEIDDEVPDLLNETLMRYRFERGMKQIQEYKQGTIRAQEKVSFTLPAKEVELTPLYPQFEYLYEDQWEIDEALLREHILNDRERLTAELCHILKTAVEGYLYMSERKWWNPAVIHALLILPYLDDQERFSNVVEFFRQPGECSDYWVIDWGNEVLTAWFRNYSEEKLQQIYDLMIESPGAVYSKISFISLLPAFVAQDPRLRDKMVQFIRTLFEYFIANRDDENLFDTDVVAFIVGAAVDLKATELLDMIEDLYNRGWVSLMIEGDFNEVRDRITGVEDTSGYHFHDDAIAHLEHIRSNWENDENELDDRDAILPDILSQPEAGDKPVIASNTPKNAPCPCGSGKKFKRCHGK